MTQSLRDEFAMSVMPALIDYNYVDETGSVTDKHTPDIDVTDQAYAWADLMLKSREPKVTPNPLEKPLTESGK